MNKEPKGMVRAVGLFITSVLISIWRIFWGIIFVILIIILAPKWIREERNKYHAKFQRNK